MQEKIVTRNLPEYGEIIKIYQSAFPQNEKLPMWLLLLMAKRRCAEFYAFYDESIFCGFTYLIHHDKTTFVLYLATETSMRSKGYGKRILQWISEKYSLNNIVLNIESVDKKFDNYEQRLRRQSFYFKNNFQQTNYILDDNGDLYDILYKGSSFSKEEYEKLLKKFSFGFVSPKLKNCKNQIKINRV